MPSPLRAETGTAITSPPPVLDEEIALGKLSLHPFGVGVGTVDLVDGHDDGHSGRLDVADGLFGLRHDPIVGGDNGGWQCRLLERRGRASQ